MCKGHDFFYIVYILASTLASSIVFFIVFSVAISKYLLYRTSLIVQKVWSRFSPRAFIFKHQHTIPNTQPLQMLQKLVAAVENPLFFYKKMEGSLFQKRVYISRSLKMGHINTRNGNICFGPCWRHC